MKKFAFIAVVFIFLFLTPVVFSEDTTASAAGVSQSAEPALPVISNEPEMPDVEGTPSEHEIPLPAPGSLTITVETALPAPITPQTVPQSDTFVAAPEVSTPTAVPSTKPAAKTKTKKKVKKSEAKSQ